MYLTPNQQFLSKGANSSQTTFQFVKQSNFQFLSCQSADTLSKATYCAFRTVWWMATGLKISLVVWFCIGLNELKTF